MLKKIAVFLSLILVIYSPVFAQKVLTLADTKFKYSPKDFFISAVADDRPDTSDIGFVKTGISDRQTRLTLKNGAANSLRHFIGKNMKQIGNTTPVELHITTLNVSEKRTNGMDKADIDVGFAFYIGGEKAIELTSSAYVKSGIDATMHIEGMIRQQTESALEQFGEWFTKNKINFLSAPSVSVEVLVDNDPKDQDYIPYSSNRMLTYSDFKGTPDKLSIAAAATASFVTINTSVLTKGKQVEITLKIGAMFDKGMSWFRENDPRVLAHEQIHFAITAYKACELIHVLRTARFSPEKYEDELQQLTKQSQRETQQMQDQYDEETDHGMNAQKQFEWREKINGLISQQDCFK